MSLFDVLGMRVKVMLSKFGINLLIIQYIIYLLLMQLSLNTKYGNLVILTT